MRRITEWINDNYFSNKRLNIWFIVLCFLFLLSRMIFLDSDLPPWDIFNYQPIDEFYYNTTAFNLYHYHAWQPQIVPYLGGDSMTQNILGNIITFFTLTIFGNNYFGLRMASVLVAFIIFVLMFYILKNYLNREEFQNNDSPHNNNNKNITELVCLVYLLLDFPFLLASRIAEPTIFRILVLVVFLYIFSTQAVEKYINSKWFVSIAGFFAVATVLYVYPNNAFIVPAVWFACFYSGLNEGLKKGLVQTCFFLLGGIICVVSYELTLRFLLGTTYLDVIATYSVFSDRVILPTGSGIIGVISVIKHYIHSIVWIFSTNIFRLNPILLTVFLCSLPIFVFNLTKRKRLRDILLASLLGFYFIQSLFINDFFYRKPVIMLPMVLILITSAVATHKEVFDHLRNNSKLLVGLKYYVVLCVCCTLGILIINSSQRLVAYDSLSDNIYILLPVYILQIICIVVLLKKTMKISKNLLISILLLFMIPNIYFGTRYIYAEPTYTFRNTMIELSHYIDNEIIVGGVAYAFRLYNTSVPVLNIYSYHYTEEGKKQYVLIEDQIVKENRSRYTIEDSVIKDIVNEAYHDKNELIYEFDLNQIVFGEQRNHLGLYKYP